MTIRDRLGRRVQPLCYFRDGQENSKLVPERQVLELERSSGFEGGGHGGCQHVKRTERRTENLRKDVQPYAFI